MGEKIRKMLMVSAVLGILLTNSFMDVCAADHAYYKGLSAEQAAEADAWAQDAANKILADKTLDTDLKKVNRASQVVYMCTLKARYEQDANGYYRSPYGVFIAGVYTCSGTTRALGRILDYLGYDWTHANENQYSHQWCVLIMDGQTGFADGMLGAAGYGEYTSGMTLSDGSTIYFQ